MFRQADDKEEPLLGPLTRLEDRHRRKKAALWIQKHGPTICCLATIVIPATIIGLSWYRWQGIDEKIHRAMTTRDEINALYRNNTLCPDGSFWHHPEWDVIPPPAMDSRGGTISVEGAKYYRTRKDFCFNLTPPAQALLLTLIKECLDLFFDFCQTLSDVIDGENEKFKFILFPIIVTAVSLCIALPLSYRLFKHCGEVSAEEANELREVSIIPFPDKIDPQIAFPLVRMEYTESRYRQQAQELVREAIQTQLPAPLLFIIFHYAMMLPFEDQRAIESAERREKYHRSMKDGDTAWRHDTVRELSKARLPSANSAAHLTLFFKRLDKTPYVHFRRNQCISHNHEGVEGIMERIFKFTG